MPRENDPRPLHITGLIANSRLGQNARYSSDVGQGSGNTIWAPWVTAKPKPKPKPEPAAASHSGGGGGGIDYSAGIPQIPVLPAAPKPPAPVLMPIPDDAAIRAAKERERAKKMAGRRSTTLTQSASNNLN